jgi:serine O-acetyltransferase
VTIGLRAGDWVGPTVERNVTIGTGAKVLGRLRVGAGARIGANAVVVADVAEGTTAVGVPARALTAKG